MNPLAVGIPPNDLRQTLPQQLLQLSTAAQLADAVPPGRVGAFVGMGVDPSVARFGARWRHGEGFIEPLTAAGVIGTMPNIPTNRINRHLDLIGGSCSVFAEELSGVRALELAARAVACGELDAAVVGAVELGDDAVHAAAAAVLPAARQQPGDAAVSLVLRREADARTAGQTVLAVLEPRSGVATANTNTNTSANANIESRPDTRCWGPGETRDATPALDTATPPGTRARGGSGLGRATADSTATATPP